VLFIKPILGVWFCRTCRGKELVYVVGTIEGDEYGLLFHGLVWFCLEEDQTKDDDGVWYFCLCFMSWWLRRINWWWIDEDWVEFYDEEDEVEDDDEFIFFYRLLPD
jgi:hypothetical protein